MSNLGWYQIMTTMAKKVGGPLKLAGLLVGGGAVSRGRRCRNQEQGSQKT